ncbi:hypothetical protein K2X85_00580, partial [bacterium]|nr:hypothetical protein [bacterium]
MFKRLQGKPKVCHSNRRKYMFDVLEDRELLAFSVLNTDPLGPGSLYAAIEAANNTAGPDEIEFNIPGSGIQSIQLSEPLPAILEQVTIDGFSQDPNSGQPSIFLDGSLLGSNANGLVIQGEGSTIRGLAIGNFSGSGIVLNSNNNIIVGNYIGLNASGSAAASNSYGITVAATDGNTIGQTAEGLGNWISGNASAGVMLDGATNVQIVANFIGLNAAGDEAIGNGVGVHITGGSHGISIGVPIDFGNGSYDPLGGNVISGNSSHGVLIDGAETNLVLVSGNKIGTSADGNTDLGNGGDGVRVADGAFSVVVGMLVGEISNGTETLTIPLYPDDSRNIISGNSGSGVSIDGSGTHDVYVTNNRIGTNADSTSDLGNTGAGVSVTGGATNVSVGRSLFNAILFQGSNGDPDVLIQGAFDEDQGNIIGGNDSGGVVIQGANEVTIAGNFIAGNTGSGVDVSGGSHGIVVGVAPDSGDGTYDALGGNLISGNSANGVLVRGSNTQLVAIAGNKIGTDDTGNNVFANGGAGVRVEDGASYVVIGLLAGTVSSGTESQNFITHANEQRNVISGNAGDGISIDGGQTNNIYVAGNIIGANADLTADLGNGGAGVSVTGGATFVGIGRALIRSAVFPAGFTLLGAFDEDQGNIIGGNDSGGVVIQGANEVTIAGNIIADNTGSGVDVSGGSHGIVVGVAPDSGD